MASKVNFTNTFTNEQIRDINDLMFLEYVQTGDFSRFHDVHTGIVSGKEIGWIGELGDIGKASRGCDPVADANSIPTITKTWDRNEFDVRLEECYKDLDNTLAVYARNKSTKVADLTDTDYMDVVVERFGRAVERLMWRLWFMDKAASHVGSGAGSQLITNAGLVPFVNWANGYWKQLAANIAGGTTTLTAVAANAQASKALQFSTLTSDIALTTLLNATYDMPVELKQRSDKHGLITRYFAEQAMKKLQEQDKHADLYNNFIDGIQVLRINGIDFFITDDWDTNIKTYNDLGATWHKPHRAVITTKDNLAYGIEGDGSFGTFDLFYDKDKRKNIIDLIDALDGKVMQDKLIHVIY